MLYGGIFILFVLLAAASRKKKFIYGDGERSEDSQKSGIEGCFYRIALLLYEWWPLKHKKNSVVSEHLARLHPGQAPPLLWRQHEVERLKLCLVMLFAGNMIALLMYISEGGGSTFVDDMYLLRDRQGGISREIGLTVRSSSGKEAETSLTVQALSYSEEEQQGLYEEMLKELQEKALGNNSSWNAVSEPLVLMETLAPYPFTLTWHSSNPVFLTSGGKVASWEDVELLSEHTALVELTVHVSGHNFEKEHSFYTKVCPKPKKPSFSEAVTEALVTLERETAEEERMRLPAEIQGEEVVWTEQKRNVSRVFFFLGLIGAVVIFLLQGRKPEKELAKKQQLMKKEYPTIISKLTLYLGAGMNIKSAWEKIAKSAKGKNVNPVYGEMLFTCREMEGGIAEAEAYARFGKRVRQQCYVRFTTLLVQNLRKGNAALLLLLRQEALAAMEEHAALIKREGEESTTKLLLPMVMLMGMVMVLIIVPAFMGM